jgi:hypothetical protein
LTKQSAWKGKNAKPEEWLRDEASADKGAVRRLEATYAGVIDHEEKALGRVAAFYSNEDGRRYDISERLSLKTLRRGDGVILTLLGCCSIAKIERKSRKAKKL